MPKQLWNLDRIKAGLEKFIKDNGRPPTASEMDKIDYLPTARTIQREYGGLEKLRTELGYPVAHFGKGESRSNIATVVNKRGQGAERELRKFLEQHFGEMFIHIERPFASSSKQRLDFFVFCPDGNFGIDVFYPRDLRSMQKSLNIKEITYKDYLDRLYFVVANPDITQESINKIVTNKKNTFPKNFFVKAYETFKSIILTKQKHTIINTDRGV